MLKAGGLNSSISTLHRIGFMADPLSRRTFLQGSAAATLLGAGGYLATIADSLAQTSGGFVTRKAAHTLATDSGEAKALRDAVRVLKNNDAVGGWRFLATYHADFCGVMASKEIHWGWYFLPWHRVYLAVFERHLQAAISEPTLALPYWDWYSSRAIPAIFTGQDNPLLDPDRRPESDEISNDRLGVLSEAELVDHDTFLRFAGGPVGADGFFTVGELEGGPHGGAHMFAGGNMSGLKTSALDPLFLAHHGNIDRLWEVWRNADPAGPRTDPTEDAWNARPFVFVGPNGQDVSHVSRETVATRDLGYEYDNTVVGGGSVVVAASDLALPLAANEELVLALTTADGRSQGFDVTAAGLTLKPTLPPRAELATALSSVNASDVAGSFRLSVKLSGIKVTAEPIQIQVYLNPAGSPDALDPKRPSFAGSLNFIGTGDSEPLVNAFVSLNRTAEQVETPLADVPIVVKVQKVGGQRESASFSKAELVIE